MRKRATWIIRFARYVPVLVALLWAATALARVGGGESFNSGRSSSSSGGGGGGDGGAIAELLIWLILRHPAVGIPVTIAVIAVGWYVNSQRGSNTTRRALDRQEAEARTWVSAEAVQGWVAAIKAKDPQFDLLKFLDRTKSMFLEVQAAWFKRNLIPVRRFLSDATWQRLATQLAIIDAQGLRDAVADMQVLEAQIIGLDQSPTFESVHVRIRARARDADVKAQLTDEQAEAEARKKPPEDFLEVWTFVRKPGVQTKIGDDISYQGTCPNCGAPFDGGAANTCQFCQAIVNSGHYDWVLSEITQASEHAAADRQIPGVQELRAADPQFSVEVLEDRASLTFWRWIDAQVRDKPEALAKVAGAEVVERVRSDLAGLKAANKRKLFLECAVGSVDTRAVEREGDKDVAQLEIRWSARMGVAVAGQPLPKLASVPMRWALILERKAGAVSNEKTGMATDRCGTCGAPLSDNGQPTCEYCGAQLATADKDWVLKDLLAWESYYAMRRAQAPTAAAARPRQPVRIDREERERLIYMMAAIAKADGVVDDSERKLLKEMSTRFRVPWANVELALQADGQQLYGNLLSKGSTEAEAFLGQLVDMALIDGKVDMRERKMLNTAALHLGLQNKLSGMLQRRG